VIAADARMEKSHGLSKNARNCRGWQNGMRPERRARGWRFDEPLDDPRTA